MTKLRLTKDCEHGEAGKILSVDDDRVEAFLSEGKSELVVDPPPAVAPAPPAVVPEPKPEPKSEPKKGRGSRGR